MTTLLRRSSSLARTSTSSLDTCIFSSSSALRRQLSRSTRLATRQRAYATVNPRDPKDDSSGANQPAGQGREGPRLRGKPARGFERLYEDAGPMSSRTLRSSKVRGIEQGRAALGFEKLYEDAGPMSSQTPSETTGASPQSSKLTGDEEKALDGLLEKIKKGLPASQTKTLEEAFRDMKRQGIPVEIREIMNHLKGGASLDLATAAKLVRLTSKMAREVAEKQMANGFKSPPPGDGSKSKSSGQEDQKKKSNAGEKPTIKDFTKNIDTGTFLTAAFVGYLLYRMVVPSENSKEITWQEFKTTFFDKGLVDKLFVLNGHRVRVELHREATGRMYPESPAQHPNFRYYFSIGSVESFDAKLEQAQNELGIPSSERIPVSYVDEVPWLSSLLGLAPTVLFIAGLYWLSRRAGSGGSQSGIFGIGKSKAKKFNHEADIQIRFKDVAGMDEAKAEIMEFVSFLKEPGQYQRLGAKIPRGALLSGPPGTGKTLLAKATAGESQVPFFSISGSEFVEIFVGVGASRVRDLFANARKNTPCIIFIDEIDAVGKARGKSAGFGGNDEREGTLNQILTEMDGFNTSEQVVVLAGTNRPDVLDKALLRPGRFDRHIAIDRPTMEGRKQIFNVHLGKIVTGEDIGHLTGRLAALTPGFSGADIANCVNEAALIGKCLSPLYEASY